MSDVDFTDQVIIITSHNEIVSHDFAGELRLLKKQIDSWNLTPTRMIMNKQDYEDILAFGNSK